MSLSPPLLVGAILFWGWQTGMWLVAVSAAVMLGAARVVPLRWDLTHAQLCRVSDFCAVLIVLLGVALMITVGNPRAVVLLFQWLPVALLPFALAHAYGTAGAIDAGVVFWSLRRSPATPPLRFDPAFPLFAIWIVAASAANVRGDGFFAGLMLLAAWPLVRLRPLAYPVGTWAAAFSCAAAIGYGAQYGLHELQIWLEGAVPEWIAGSGSRTNPYRSMTDMGEIGELKQSDTILLRVVAPDKGEQPLLLHRASYNEHMRAAWLASSSRFAEVTAGTGAGAWPLAPGSTASRQVTIHDFSGQPDSILSLPAGTVSIDRLDARRVRKNQFGAVQVERAPGYFSYSVQYDPQAIPDAAPTPVDLRIARAERDMFAQLAAQLGLIGEAPAKQVRVVERHFRDHYRYSTFQTRRTDGVSPVVDFVQRTRSGHCEYFATATALLLRAAGVPARYATGFSVQEYSTIEAAYVVRERHAHAWVRAWVDGKWADVDTTPPEWFAAEAAGTPAWSRARDLWSWLRFRLAREELQIPDTVIVAAALLVTPFALWIGWRLFRSRRATASGTTRARAARDAGPGRDSDYFLLERRLAELGWQRHAHETPAEWLSRLQCDGISGLEPWPDILRLHYRYRFDPLGLAPRERAALASAVADWLARNRTA